jgi:hypothetical protein
VKWKLSNGFTSTIGQRKNEVCYMRMNMKKKGITILTKKTKYILAEKLRIKISPILNEL